MRVIAFIGPSGSGKTSLMNEIENRLQTVRGIPEATKGEICNFSNLPLIDHNKASRDQLLKYDLGRIEYQLKMEIEEFQKGHQDIILDKPVPVALMYALTMSCRSISNDLIRDLVGEVKEHTRRHYKHIVLFPPNRQISRDITLERTFSSKYILNLQFAALQEIISWLDCPWLKLGYSLKNRADDVIRCTQLGV